MKTLKLRRGPSEYLPMLHEAELVYTTDTNELYIGGVKGNTTPDFNGGHLNDSTKGRLIPRHGSIYDIDVLVPGELFYLEDKESLAVGLEANHYLILNEDLTTRLGIVENSYRDKNTKLEGQDIENNQITFQHLSGDVRQAITTIDDAQIDLILAPDSITEKMLRDQAVTQAKLSNEVIDYIINHAEGYDFGRF